VNIDDRILTRSGRVLSGVSVAVALIGMAALVAWGRWDLMVEEFALHSGALAIGFGALLWVTITTQTRNGAIWALGGSAFFAALSVAGVVAAALYGHALTDFEDMESIVSDVPLLAAAVIQPLAWAWIPALFLFLTLGLLLFPDGRPPSPRWRWVGRVSVVAIVLSVGSWIWITRPSRGVPLGASPSEGPLVALAGLMFLVILACVGLSVAALIVRYRRSSGVTRRQIRWIAWGGTVFAAVILWTFLLEGEGGTVWWMLAAEALLIVSFAVAINKYRLYDIDIVISRTVTYGALAIVITALYVTIVVGISTVVGRGGEPNLPLAIAATAAVALLFDPIRSRLQRWANRLVYGERATPYEVLARFSQRAAAAEGDDEMLARIPRLIVDGTGASEATLWTVNGDSLRPAAWWPEQEHGADAVSVVGDGEWSDPEADYSLPVEHDGELLGGLSLVASRGGTITPTEQELVQNLAGGLGLALRNARLTDDLRDQVTELAASRERILAAADEARRGLERDLDMGPQQELVAVKVKLGVVKSLAEAANAAKTAEVLAQLEHDTGTAIESVRDFARGVYPPLLEADGLPAAISAEAAKAAMPVRVEAGGVQRYPREVETAVFFAILEALQNAAKYAEASSARVEIVQEGDHITFAVSDDGRGFDPAAVVDGTGIDSMTDRLDAAGGTLTIDSAPGHGTTVKGSVPTTTREPVTT
jgi:signal transduction histidine kinase